MSWIQENKFVAGLAGVTGAVSGVLLFLGYSQGSAYDDKVMQYEEHKGRLSQLEKSHPYPSEDNLSARREGLDDYEKGIAEVRSLVAGYRPENLEKLSPEQFKDEQVKMSAALHAAFKEAGTDVPKECLFGFENYAAGSVRSDATALLKYELDALQWMFANLAKAKPAAINNVRRTVLSVETGQAAAPVTRQRGGRKKSGKVAGRAYQVMPVELSFTASEDTVRQFLIGMATSKEYYYSIRGVRFQNEKQTPPTFEDADFAAGGEAPVVEEDFGASSGPSFGEEGAAAEEDTQPVVEAAPKESSGQRVLKQVLGSELVRVHVCFDIVLIAKNDSQAKPVKKRAAADGANSSAERP